MPALSGKWEEKLKPEFSKPYYRELYREIREEYRSGTVYPPASEIFTAFHLTPLEKVKCVILGQDPYHEPGQAHGLSFSVKKGVEIPPSLVNIYKELQDDLGVEIPTHGNLSHWADEGVLLLNTLLTVRAHQAFSHEKLGWKQFTDAAIQAVDGENRPIAFILWGKPAQSKRALIRNENRLIIESPHPSPLSAYRGFFGSHPFSRVNNFLVSHGSEPIDWRIGE